jgi:hypothetical protein
MDVITNISSQHQHSSSGIKYNAPYSPCFFLLISTPCPSTVSSIHIHDVVSSGELRRRQSHCKA